MIKIGIDPDVTKSGFALTYYYFGTPEKFISNKSKVDYFSVNYNYIKIPSEVLFQIQNGYLQHPDYKQ